MKRRKTERRKRRFSWRRLLAVVLLMTMLIMLMRLAWYGYFAALGEGASAATPFEAIVHLKAKVIKLANGRMASDTADSGGAANESDGLPPVIPFAVQEITNTHFGALVNAEYGIRDVPASSLVPAWPTVFVLSKDITLNKTALKAISEMFTAASAANIGSFYISSGFRDYHKQQQVYDEQANKSYVQLPGHSEHETGLAADLMVSGLTRDDVAASPQGEWLAGNAWQYGLILRYPQDKQSITGVAYEPWHFRYVGQPAAWYCEQNNLCFEEYIQFLKDKGGYSAMVGSIKYFVFYETPQEGMIHVPVGWNYNVSGDNTGGYIITVWEKQ